MFNKILESLSEPIKSILINIPVDIKKLIQEIRLRSDRALTLISSNNIYFVNRDSSISSNLNGLNYIVRDVDIQNCFRFICGHSIHSYQDEIKNGFITIKGGHRVGFCGTAVKEEGKIKSVKDINSINIRVAIQKNGIAKNLVEELFSKEINGVLIVGPPSSGKTTLLKDIIRILAGGFNGKYIKISLIDERGEIAAINKGIPNNDLGIFCDIFDGYSKVEGMNIAIRTMSPDIIACDEIGMEDDSFGIIQSLNAGVSVIATAHASSLCELYKREHIYKLILTGAFKYIVILEDRKNPCKIKDIIRVGDEKDDKVTGGYINSYSIVCNRDVKVD